jgi:hypothetical protein
VHHRLTRRWAMAEGFSDEDAETLGLLNDGVDAHKGDFFHPWNWRFHFGKLGAWDTAAARLESACAAAGGGPDALGDLAFALHAIQDAIGHGVFGPLTHGLYPDIDTWDARDDATRAEIERMSREALATYRSAVLLADERKAAGAA